MEILKKLFRFAGEVDKSTSLAVNILGWGLLVFFWWLIHHCGLDKTDNSPLAYRGHQVFQDPLCRTGPALQNRLFNIYQSRRIFAGLGAGNSPGLSHWIDPFFQAPCQQAN